MILIFILILILLFILAYRIPFNPLEKFTHMNPTERTMMNPTERPMMNPTERPVTTFVEKYPYNIIICGLVRNSAKTLLKNLESLRKITSVFDNSRFIIVENDSTDGTDIICRDWKESLPHGKVILLSQHIDFDSMDFNKKFDLLDNQINTEEITFSNKRFNKMAYLRNLYMEKLENIPWFGSDNCIVIMVDLDIVRIEPHIVLDVLEKYLIKEKGELSWNVLCSTGISKSKCGDEEHTFWGIPSKQFCVFQDYDNTMGHYYDSLALRFIDDDFELTNKTTNDDIRDHELKSWDYFKNHKDPPVEVKSCFGGLSIYKSGVIKGLKYSSGDCEHVSFLRNVGGGIYSVPELVVYYD